VAAEDKTLPHLQLRPQILKLLMPQPNNPLLLMRLMPKPELTHKQLVKRQ